MRWFFALILSWLTWPLDPLAAEPRFDPARDVFSFANETYYEYQTDADGRVTFHRRSVKEEDQYSRYCFVLVRAVIQFHRFAVFRPDLPKASDAEYREKVVQLSRISAWSPGPVRKVTIPGYPDLWSFSTDHALLLQANLGRWWPAFWRLGNWRMALPSPRAGQQRLASWLRTRLDSGRIQGVYLTRFRPINHCLVVYGYTVQPNGDVDFAVYDCNQPAGRPILHYSAERRSFYWPRNWYWAGGLVNALKLYVSPLM